MVSLIPVLVVGLVCQVGLAAGATTLLQQNDNDGDDEGVTEREETRTSEDQRGVIETLPEHRGGQDIVGTKLPKFEFDRWLRQRATNDDPEVDAEAAEDTKDAGGEVDDARADIGRHKATLYRWWTDSCPYCESSLPAVEQLREKYEDKGLRTVAVYHPKPPRKIDDDVVIAKAEQWSYHGDIALDQDWSILREFYLSTGQRRATSASFLVDAEGVIRFVHPGPEFYPSDDLQAAQQNRDYRLLEKAIRTLANDDADADGSDDES